MYIKVWNIEAETGYKPITTFYEDFSIAETFGQFAIIDTFNRAFNEWKNDYKYLTELVMTLNWKIWEHFEDNREFANTYESLWEKTDAYAMENLVGDALNYFIRVTD